MSSSPAVSEQALRPVVLLVWIALAIGGALVFWPTAGRLVLAGGVYLALMFGVTAGYHRYFAHKSFRTSRVGQAALAWLAQTSLQNGVLWWASHHREHHRSADQAADPHSPLRRGFWHAHLGWLFQGMSSRRDDSLLRDLLRFRELRWLDRVYWLPALVYVVLLGLVGGGAAVVWGFVVPALACQQVTLLINSLAHTWGSRAYATADTSRNNLLLALLTLGEGWHNNHHFFPGAARQGFTWWQFDPTWMVLRALAATGIVWDLRAPPAHVLAARGRAVPGSLRPSRRGGSPPGPRSAA